MKKNSSSLVKDQWLVVLQQLAPELNLAIERFPRHVPCPVHGGSDGFRLFKDVNETGGGVCNSCGVFASGWRLLQWLKSWTYLECKQEVMAVLKGASTILVLPQAASTPSAKPINYSKRREKQKRLFQTAYPLDTKEAELGLLYFTKRGIALNLDDLPQNIHYAPSLEYYANGVLSSYQPALLSQLTTLSGELGALHRTYLDEHGNKFQVNDCKKLR